ncbi:MAG: polysaccharide biosynthesis protein [Planctomycetota bacterium]|nr:MAG: polysaccharide biosynthesis protein [Planctomycetota bacterium]
MATMVAQRPGAGLRPQRGCVDSPEVGDASTDTRAERGEPDERDEARAIAGGVGSVLGARLASALAALCAQILIARWLGPEGNGLLAAATSVLALGMLLADLSLNVSVSRLLAVAYYGRPSAIPRVLRTGALAKGTLTLGVGAALALGAGRIAEALHADAALVPVLVLAAAQLVFDNAATFGFRALQGLHRPRLQALAQLTAGVGSPLLSLLLVALVLGQLPWRAGPRLAQLLGGAFGAVGTGASATVAGRALGAAAAAAVAWWLLVRIVGRAAAAPPAGEPRPVARRPLVEIVRFARNLVWVQLAYIVIFRMDIALVQFYLGERATGLYAIPSLVGERLMLPAVSLATVVAPYFAALGDPQRQGLLARLLHRSVRALTLFYLPAAAGLAAIAPDAVRVVFGPAYDPAAPLVRAYAFVLPLLAYATLLGQLLDYAGLARARAAAFVAAALLDLGCNALLIPRWGAVGAIVSLALSFTPLLVAYAVVLGRRVGVSRRAHARAIARTALASVLMGAGVWALRPDTPGGGGLARLVALVLAGVVFYAVALRAVGGIEPGELGRLRALVRRPRR